MGKSWHVSDGCEEYFYRQCNNPVTAKYRAKRLTEIAEMKHSKQRIHLKSYCTQFEDEKSSEDNREQVFEYQRNIANELNGRIQEFFFMEENKIDYESQFKAIVEECLAI